MAAVVGAEGQELLAIAVTVTPAGGQRPFNLMEGKGIVPCGHWRMGGENRLGTHGGQGLVEAVSAVAMFTQALEDHKAGVTLVEVPHGGRDAQRPQGQHATHTQDRLLLQSGVAVAAVQACGQFPIPRRVFRQVGVEQVEPHPGQPDAPHGDVHRAIAERDLHRAGAAHIVRWEKDSRDRDSLKVYKLGVGKDAKRDKLTAAQRQERVRKRKQMASLLGLTAGPPQ